MEPDLTMQCKDIPDVPVLRFLMSVSRPATWYGSEPLFDNTVLHAMPAGVDPKLALAKMRMLIRRGVVEGCGCGCRGEFEITDKGRAEISAGASDATG